MILSQTVYTYPCVFDLTKDCPVKKAYKLRPESLVLFCKECPIRINEVK